MKSNFKTLLTSTPSDSHTWNLIYMELFLQENGCQVHNLGACVPIQDLYEAIYRFQPELVVISSINGHLFQDAIEIIENLKDKKKFRFVVGGKLGILSHSTQFQKVKLKKLGYDEVFTEKNALSDFKNYLNILQADQMKNCLKYAV